MELRISNVSSMSSSRRKPVPPKAPSAFENIEFLIDGNGEITVGAVGPIRCAATAVDEDQCLAMLVRRPGESLVDLLQRLDAAIGDAYENERLHRRSQHTAKFQTIRQVTRVASSCLRSMDSLLDEMRQCKSVKACIDLALTDAYGEEEQAVAWLTCIEKMFGRFKQVRLMGNEVALVGFDLKPRRGRRVPAGKAQGPRDHRTPSSSLSLRRSNNLAAGVETILCVELANLHRDRPAICRRRTLTNTLERRTHNPQVVADKFLRWKQKRRR